MAKNEPDIQSEARGESAAQHYEALLDNLPGAAYRKEYYARDARITYLSKGFEKLTGHAPEKLISVSLAERLESFWHPDDHARVLEFSEKILAGKEDLECKVRIRRADNRYVWVLIREKVVKRTAATTFSEGMVIDIDEEMSSKEELKRYSLRLEERATELRTLIGNLSGVVFRMIYPPGGAKYATLVYGERKVPKAVLMDPGRLRAIVHPDDMTLLYEEVPRRLREDGYSEHIHRVLTGDGDTMWFRTREKLVGWDGDNMIVEGQTLDITEKMLTKFELEESEQRRRRAEMRLQEGRRLESLGRFASGVAHDFNNILGAILSYASLVRDDLPTDTIACQNVSRVLAAAEQGRSVIDQILQYAGEQDVKPEWFDVERLISDTFALCKNNGDCEVEHLVEVVSADTWIRADETQLGRAFLNLFKNACEATSNPGGLVRVTIKDIHISDSQLDTVFDLLRSRRVDRSVIDVESWQDEEGVCWAVSGVLEPLGAYVVISVADNGTGMDQVLLDQVFAPFFTTKGRSGGSGLGLSVVHGITLAHGGAIRVQSRLGEGTKFDLIIPRDCDLVRPRKGGQ